MKKKYPFGGKKLDFHINIKKKSFINPHDKTSIDVLKNINKERLDHLIFDYVSKDCFEIKDINSFIKKLVVRKCNEFKN